LFILSFTFVLVLMMKANLVAIWAGFGIVLVIKWIFEKKYKELIRNLSFVLLFVLLSLLPFFLYFYYKGTLSDAIYLVFKFNIFEYNPRSNTSMLREYFMILSGDFYLSIIPAVTVIYMLFRDKTAINGGILSAFFFTALTSLLGISFRYYLIIFIPLLVIPYAYIFAVIESSIPKAKYACLCIIFMFYNLNATFEQTRNILDNYSERGYGIATISPPTMEILKKIIIQNTEPVDKILVRGGQVSVYLYSNRTCATRFPFCLKDASLSIKYYVKDVEKALPKLIIQGDVVSSPDTFKLDTLLNNKYYLLATDIENVEFWKLKE